MKKGLQDEAQIFMSTVHLDVASAGQAFLHVTYMRTDSVPFARCSGVLTKRRARGRYRKPQYTKGKTQFGDLLTPKEMNVYKKKMSLAPRKKRNKRALNLRIIR